MKIKLVRNDSEIAAGTRGSSMGFDALRVASLNLRDYFFGKYDIVEVKDRNDLLYDNVKHPYAKYIEGLNDLYDSIIDKVANVITEGNFPVVIAGDHASAGGTIQGIKKANPNKRLGVFWIDAHADIHSPYTTPSGNMHGMPVAIALGIDNKEVASNNIDDNTKQIWEELKEGGPFLKPEDLVFMGVRDTERQEDFIIKKLGIKNYTVDTIRQRGIDEVVDESLDRLSECDIIYISFDVDSMDCDLVSGGTGTPVPNGFTPEECTRIIDRIIDSGKVCCFEMVEINPTLDEKNIMARTAFMILKNTTRKLESKFPD